MSDCLTPNEIENYRAGTLPSAEAVQATENHLDACAACQNALRARLFPHAAWSLAQKLAPEPGAAADQTGHVTFPVTVPVTVAVPAAQHDAAPRALPTHRSSGGGGVARPLWRRLALPASFGLGAAAVAGAGVYLAFVPPLRQQNQSLQTRLARVRTPPAAAARPATGGSTGADALAPVRRLETVLRDGLVLPPAARALAVGQTTLRSNTGKGSAPEPAIALLRPVATWVRSDTPALQCRLPGRATAAQLTVVALDRPTDPVPTVFVGPGRWRMAAPLRRGRTYEWWVTARRNGQVLESPVARFAVVSQTQARVFEQTRERYAGLPLTLGVLYAEAGLLDDAEQTFEQVARRAPRPSTAANLLRDLRVKRHSLLQ